MTTVSVDNYFDFELDHQASLIMAWDHLEGFDADLKSWVLDRMAEQLDGRPVQVQIEYIVNDTIRQNYPNFEFKFWMEKHCKILDSWQNYRMHPEQTFENFLCSFNGSPTMGRKLLVTMLHKFGLFHPDFCTKNFLISEDMISGHIKDFVGDRQYFYDKFFLRHDRDFYDTIYSKGNYFADRYSGTNIACLDQSLAASFVHLVSETLSTSYYPFYGEKFLQSVVTRGLFVAYAQPNWHEMLEKWYGFKKYDKIFDYRFDHIQNPLERMIELISMLLKFRYLSSDDWRDLYEMEKDTIEYNYDWYFSRQYVTCLERACQT
jgi:hypothetical protein